MQCCEKYFDFLRIGLIWGVFGDVSRCALDLRNCVLFSLEFAFSKLEKSEFTGKFNRTLDDSANLSPISHDYPNRANDNLIRKIQPQVHCKFHLTFFTDFCVLSFLQLVVNGINHLRIMSHWLMGCLQNIAILTIISALM